jgi:tetratricopeptide (TPR) repeat protein
VASKAASAGAGSPANLLARAQLLRSDGRYRDCAAAYRQLIARHPRSDEARVALVSLGELELSELSRPALALRAFDDYLRSHGPLAREARFGRIRALRGLSKTTEEKEAITAFLKDYPDSAQAASLRHRSQTR